ncbi:hypothetical protein KKF84_19090 [Myxococcota bacterium]|nr:hypothetical protein [Myxococcota bacterium]
MKRQAWLILMMLSFIACTSYESSNDPMEPSSRPLDHSMEILYHNPEKEIIVYRVDGRVILRIKGFIQAVKESTTPALFSDPMVDLVPASMGKSHNAMVIGLGGGKTASDLITRGFRVDVVELEAEVARIAKEHFGYAGDVIIADGLEYLKRSVRAYDVILLDAFSGDKPPDGMIGPEGFGLINSRLAPGGVLIMRVIDNPYRKGFRAYWRKLGFDTIFSTSFGKGRQTLYISNLPDSRGESIRSSFPLRLLGVIDPYVVHGKELTLGSNDTGEVSVAGYLFKSRNGELVLQLPHYEMGNHLIVLKGALCRDLLKIATPMAGRYRMNPYSEEGKRKTLSTLGGGGLVSGNESIFSDVMVGLQGTLTYMGSGRVGSLPTPFITNNLLSVHSLKVSGVHWRISVDKWRRYHDRVIRPLEMERTRLQQAKVPTAKKIDEVNAKIRRALSERFGVTATKLRPYKEALGFDPFAPRDEDAPPYLASPSRPLGCAPPYFTKANVTALQAALRGGKIGRGLLNAAVKHFEKLSPKIREEVLELLLDRLAKDPAAHVRQMNWMWRWSSQLCDHLAKRISAKPFSTFTPWLLKCLLQTTRKSDKGKRRVADPLSSLLSAAAGPEATSRLITLLHDLNVRCWSIQKGITFSQAISLAATGCEDLALQPEDRFVPNIGPDTRRRLLSLVLNRQMSFTKQMVTQVLEVMARMQITREEYDTIRRGFNAYRTSPFAALVAVRFAPLEPALMSSSLQATVSFRISLLERIGEALRIWHCKTWEECGGLGCNTFTDCKRSVPPARWRAYLPMVSALSENLFKARVPGAISAVARFWRKCLPESRDPAAPWGTITPFPHEKQMLGLLKSTGKAELRSALIELLPFVKMTPEMLPVVRDLLDRMIDDGSAVGSIMEALQYASQAVRAEARKKKLRDSFIPVVKRLRRRWWTTFGSPPIYILAELLDYREP